MSTISDTASGTITTGDQSAEVADRFPVMTQDELIDAWILDLRTTKAPQAVGKLFDGKGYCCLGRLCIVAGMSNENIIHHRFPPLDIAESIGMTDGGRRWDHQEIKLPNHNKHSLAGANDDGCTFAEIADVIEENRDQLFRKVQP